MNYCKYLILSLALLIIKACVPINNNGGNNANEELTQMRMELTNEWDGTRVFNHPDNPFLQEIPTDYTRHPDSDSIIGYLDRVCKNPANNMYNVRIGMGFYSSPVYLVNNTMKRHDVFIYYYTQNGFDLLKNVHIPNYATPAEGTDGHMSLINKDTECLHEFWVFHNKLHNVFDQKGAASANAISINSSGMYEDGRSTIVAGWSQLLGALWPAELSNGEINHALSFSAVNTKKDFFVFPAKHTDGTDEHPFALPVGSLLRIRPDVDIDALLGVSNIDKVILKAIQKFGMYCGDTNGAGVAIGAVHHRSFIPNVYKNIFGSTYSTENNRYYMHKFPFELMEVVYTGPLQTYGSSTFHPTACAEWGKLIP